MEVFKLLKNFENDESGAVTVDWVVLTAAIVALGLAIIVALRPGLENGAITISGELNDAASGTNLTITVP